MSIKLITPTKQSILDTPIPPTTRTYKAISHAQIINTLEENLDKEGFTLTGEHYSATADQQIVNGHLCLATSIDNELSFEIAFMNSYNKKKRAVVVGGSKVIICGNGHVLGDTSHGLFKKKHVGTALPEILSFIPEMIKGVSETFQRLVKQKERMKEIEIDRKIRAQLIGQLYLDEAIITDTQMSLIRKQVQKSSFDYGTDGETLWDTYNYVTFGLKETHPSRWITNHQKLNQIISDKFSLA